MTREAFSPSPSYPIMGTGPYQITHPYKEGTLVVAAVLDGNRVELLESEYVVFPLESLTTGEITLTAQFAADYAGATLYIRRMTEIEQGWLGQSSREKGLEAQMDWLAEAVQDLRTDSRRTVRLDNPIKTATSLPGHVLTFDESGTPIPGPSVSAISAKGDGVLNEFEKSFTVIDPAGQKTFALNSDPINKILCEVFVTKFGQTERLKQSEFSLAGLDIGLNHAVFPPASVSIRYRVPAQTSAASSTEMIKANSGLTLEDELSRRGLIYYSRAEAEAATIPADIVAFSVFEGGILTDFARGGATACLTTGGGATWSPAGDAVNPAHWGGVAGYAADATAAVQAAVDFVRAGYDANLGTFTRWLDLGGQVWRCTSSINATNIRQPNFRFGNGGVFFDMTSGYGWEMWGTNSAIIVGTFWVETPEDPTACPEVAFGFGRAEHSGVAAPIAPSLKGTLYVDGCCSKASVANLASEVSHLKVFGHNSHPDKYATVYAGIGNMGYATLWWGAELSSPFVTLPTQADGDMSNILHSFEAAEFKRDAGWNVTITGITKANPAVVSFSGNAAQVGRMANGQDAYLTNVGGMEEIKYQRLALSNLVVNGDGVTGTFELPIDSTSFTTFTSGGTAWRATGYSCMFGNAKGVNIGPEAYLLSYSESNVLLDCRLGSVTKVSIDAQHEAGCVYPIEMNVGATSQVIQDMRVNLMSASQVMKAPFLLTRTTGTMRIDDLRLKVSQHAGAFSNGLCQGGGSLTVRNGDLAVPQGVSVATLAAFTGWVLIMDPQSMRWYGDRDSYIEMVGNSFRVTGVSDGVADIPYLDFRPIKTTTVNDVIGYMRYITDNKSYGGIRGRVKDATSGFEDFAFEFVGRQNGTDQNLAQVDSTYGGESTSLVLRLTKGGVASFDRIVLGPVDSGGAGYRALRIPN